MNGARPPGEDAVVAAIERLLAETPGGAGRARVVLGIGDDAALWQPSRSHRSAITSDALVEGVHFTAELMSLEDAGWRALVANASDLAAMGARPVLATVALGVPESASLDDVVMLYRGLAAAAADAGMTIAGGDLTRSPVWTIAIAAVGEVRASNVKLRSGGRPGDVLAVTAPLGSARAGLAVARGEAGIPDDAERRESLTAFRRPVARLAEGRFLAASKHVRAMMDCSDGLSTDLDRLCRASGCGAELERVPVAGGARAVAAALGEDPERFALAGGEDFELLVAVRPRGFAHLAERFGTRFGRTLTAVGRLVEGDGVRWGGEPVARSGWDHFATEVRAR